MLHANIDTLNGTLNWNRRTGEKSNWDSLRCFAMDSPHTLLLRMTPKPPLAIIPSKSNRAICYCPADSDTFIWERSFQTSGNRPMESHEIVQYLANVFVVARADGSFGAREDAAMESPSIQLIRKVLHAPSKTSPSQAAPLKPPLVDGVQLD